MKEVCIIFKSHIYHWATNEEYANKQEFLSELNEGEKAKDWISPVSKKYEKDGKLFIENDYNGKTYIYNIDEIESYFEYNVDEKGDKI